DARRPQAAAVPLARAAVIGAVDADAEGGGLNRHGGLLSSGAEWCAVVWPPGGAVLRRPRLGSIVTRPAGDASSKSAKCGAMVQTGFPLAPFVPTLRVGTHALDAPRHGPPMSEVPRVLRARDAERPVGRSHAERGNEDAAWERG